MKLKLNSKLVGLGMGIAVGILSTATLAKAGDQVVEGAAAPGSAGNFDAPTFIEGSDSSANQAIGDYGRVLDRADDGVTGAADGSIEDGTLFAGSPIEGASTTDFTFSSGGSLSAADIATAVPPRIVALNPVTIQLRGRSLQITPGLSETTVAVVTSTETVTQQYTGTPDDVSQQIGAVSALIAADAPSDATAAGSSIAAVGAPAPQVVNLILGFQRVGGDFTIARLPEPLQQPEPVLVASADLSAGLLIAESQKPNRQELSAVIAAYNQVILNCPPEALPALASNPEFQTIGNQLRQLRASL